MTTIPPLSEASTATTTFSELLAKYDLVDVDASNGVVVVSERPGVQLANRDDPFNPATAPLEELGSSSPSPWTSWLRRDYNSEMVGVQGLRNYDKMRRSDGTVRSTLRVVKTPVLGARWYMEPASESTRDKNVAKFVWQNLTEWMTMSWTQFLVESLLCLDFGYYMFEKVFDLGENVTSDPSARGKIIWRKLAPRHPLDVIQWYYDQNGGPDGVQMYDAATNRYVALPISKLLVFTYDREAGNMEGISVLRSAWRNWFYKDQLYKIDSIQKERHGIGIPIIILPPGFSPRDKALADELGRNIRTNERAHIVLPTGWQFMFAKLEGQPVDALKSAVHHDEAIRQNVMAGFLTTDVSTREEDQTLFLKSTRYIADVIAEIINYHAIPELVDYNWMRVGYPKLCAKRIGENADWRTLSFAIRNFIGAGVIVPDEKLEQNIRDELDLPKADPETARVVQLPSKTEPGSPEQVGPQPPTPANPTPSQNVPGAPSAPQLPRVGPPRQSTTPPVGTPARNAGRDASGG